MFSESDISIYEYFPHKSPPKLHVAGCFVHYAGKILLLQRARGKDEENLWGIPAGKVEREEDIAEAAVRELKEETGISVSVEELQTIPTLYMERNNFCYGFHMFYVRLHDQPEIHLATAENQNYAWLYPQEAYSWPLMKGAPSALNMFRHKYSDFTAKQRAFVNVHLILRHKDKILLSLRQNTGYFDGLYTFPTGHVEKSEDALTAIQREALEELGIVLKTECLRVVHTMHRKSDRMNIDIFYETSQWEGDIRNCEPEKCLDVQFFSIPALPRNVADFHCQALDHLQKDSYFSEFGW